jgi:hypothetical protein
MHVFSVLCLLYYDRPNTVALAGRPAPNTHEPSPRTGLAVASALRLIVTARPAKKTRRLFMGKPPSAPGRGSKGGPGLYINLKAPTGFESPLSHPTASQVGPVGRRSGLARARCSGAFRRCGVLRGALTTPRVHLGHASDAARRSHTPPTRPHEPRPVIDQATADTSELS